MSAARTKVPSDALLFSPFFYIISIILEREQRLCQMLLEPALQQICWFLQ